MIKSTSPAKPTYKSSIRTLSPSKGSKSSIPTVSPSKMAVSAYSPARSTNYIQTSPAPANGTGTGATLQRSTSKYMRESSPAAYSSKFQNPNNSTSNLQKSVPSPNNSKNKEPQPMGQQNLKIISTMELDRLLDKIKSNRDLLCQNIDIYCVLLENSAPMRCLAHNNFATLYCENEQRQLCVNCVYNNIHHKLHKVVPIKNVMEVIQDNNMRFELRISKAVEGFEQFEKTSVKTVLALEQGLKRTLETLSSQMDAIQRKLEARYRQLKSKAIAEFEEAKLKYEILADQGAALKTLYSNRGRLDREQKSDVYSLFTHMVFNTLLDGDKYDSRTTPVCPIDDSVNKFTAQFTKLREAVDRTLVLDSV